MKLVNGFDLMEYAKKRKLLLPAFNTTNLEMTYAIARGLNEAGMPGYIQISSSNLKLSNPKMIADIARDAVKNVEVPIALHLDHGKSFEDVKQCLDAGFTSIMVDASHLPYEENIAEVKKAAAYCHFYNVPVEAELGAIGGKEDDVVNEAEGKTDPDLVSDFVERTGCDLLAVSVGNVHGLCLNPKIDLELLHKISDVSRVPIVFHGGSGIDFGIIRKAKKYNLIKINYGSDIRKEFIGTFGRAFSANHNEYDVIHLSLESVKNITKKVKELVLAINEDEMILECEYAEQ